MSYTYTISPQIFERYPGYVRGVVLAHDVRNSPTPPALVSELRAAEEALRAQLTLEQVAEHPRLKAWREAFRAFGAKPTEFRPSIEALARRVLRGEPLPVINTLVDIGNIISLRHLLPAGAHAIDRLEADLALRFATGSETFVPFGTDLLEHPQPGEVIFAEGEVVITRRWAWRQANRTLTLPETTAVEFNVDGLPPATPAEVEQTCEETAALIRQYCGGQVRWQILSAQTPNLSLAAA